MAKVSIIIPCYNLGAYVEESVQSALAQTYHDVEIVLINDGSTEQATLDVLKRLESHPQLRIIHTENQGVARARNTAIEQARGSYILPLDADDRILPCYAERAAGILDVQPEVGFVGCHYRIFGDRETECKPAAYRLPDLLVENVVPVASMYRRACWEQVGGYCPELNSIEDWDLWLGILGHGYQAMLIPEILFEYRVRPNSNLGHIRNPDTYETRMRLLYQRHNVLYNQYRDSILLLKDRQFANLHSYASWLEQQVKNWQNEAGNQQKMREALQHNLGWLGSAHVWYTSQRYRWERLKMVHPTRSAQIRKIGSKVFGSVRRNRS